MDIEKTIQFLLEQQARFYAQQAELSERQAEFQVAFNERQAEFEVAFDARQAEFQVTFNARQEKVQDNVLRLSDSVLSLAASQERTNEILATLVEKHVELTQSHNALYKFHESTERKLDTIINTLERHIENHQ